MPKLIPYTCMIVRIYNWYFVIKDMYLDKNIVYISLNEMNTFSWYSYFPLLYSFIIQQYLLSVCYIIGTVLDSEWYQSTK